MDAMTVARALAKFSLKAFSWPPFVFAVLCIQFNVALAVYRIKWLDFKNKRNDPYALGKVLKDIHRLTILRAGTNELHREPCMYLLNHRSWADFMIDQYVTEGRSMFVGRWAVLAAFPLAMIPLRAIRCVLLFRRGHITDIEGFNNWIDTQFAASPQTGLAVYPEGHRSTHGESLPLKRGMLKYAYTRKLPVQIVIGGNKESSLSEKHHTARFHQTVAVGFSEVLRPEDFSNFEIFMQKVQSTWDKEWNEVFSSSWEGFPMLPEVEEPQFDYPMDIRIIMAICVVLNIFLAALFVSFTWSRVAAVMTFLGFLKWPVALILVVYNLASFYVYSRPDDVGSIHQKMLQQRKQAPSVVAAAGVAVRREVNGDKKEE